MTSRQAVPIAITGLPSGRKLTQLVVTSNGQMWALDQTGDLYVILDAD